MAAATLGMGGELRSRIQAAAVPWLALDRGRTQPISLPWALRRAFGAHAGAWHARRWWPAGSAPPRVIRWWPAGEAPPTSSCPLSTSTTSRTTSGLFRTTSTQTGSSLSAPRPFPRPPSPAALRSPPAAGTSQPSPTSTWSSTSPFSPTTLRSRLAPAQAAGSSRASPTAARPRSRSPSPVTSRSQRPSAQATGFLQPSPTTTHPFTRLPSTTGSRSPPTPATAARTSGRRGGGPRKQPPQEGGVNSLDVVFDILNMGSGITHVAQDFHDPMSWMRLTFRGSWASSSRLVTRCTCCVDWTSYAGLRRRRRVLPRRASERALR